MLTEEQITERIIAYTDGQLGLGDFRSWLSRANQAPHIHTGGCRLCSVLRLLNRAVQEWDRGELVGGELRARLSAAVEREAGANA